MFSYIANRFSCLKQSLLYSLLTTFQFFSRLGSFLTERLMFTTRSPNDLESNIAGDVPEISPAGTYWVTSVEQHDLDILGIGSFGQIYDVGDDIVLKACHIWEPPGSDASRTERRRYAGDTAQHFNSIKDERTVFKILQKRPHPHIIEAIDTDQPEGLYLRKYRQLPTELKSTQALRIKFYREIADALCHLHSLGIVHSDLRLDNVLCDDNGSAILCDLGCAGPFGSSSAFCSKFELPVTGPWPTLSEASDMFALAFLMFRMEHDSKPELWLKNGEINFPEVKSGNQCIDEVIQTAWLGGYACTSDMLHRLESIDAPVHLHAAAINVIPDLDLLKKKVLEWRNRRREKYGCVLKGILSEEELKELAEQHNMEQHKELEFPLSLHLC